MSADGSAPFIGEIPEAGGARPRTAHRGERVAQAALDGTRSPEMAQRNAEAQAALALHNSGGSAGDRAGGLSDPENVLGGG
jgi:hypothetical protein